MSKVLNAHLGHDAKDYGYPNMRFTEDPEKDVGMDTYVTHSSGRYIDLVADTPHGTDLRYDYSHMLDDHVDKEAAVLGVLGGVRSNPALFFGTGIINHYLHNSLSRGAKGGSSQAELMVFIHDAPLEIVEAFYAQHFKGR